MGVGGGGGRRGGGRVHWEAHGAEWCRVVQSAARETQDPRPKVHSVQRCCGRSGCSGCSGGSGAWRDLHAALVEQQAAEVVQRGGRLALTVVVLELEAEHVRDVLRVEEAHQPAMRHA